jgi:hypothetical protein
MDLEWSVIITVVSIIKPIVINPTDFLPRTGYFENFQSLYCDLQQLGNLLSLCREIAGARDFLQKFENLKKQHQ